MDYYAEIRKAIEAMAKIDKDTILLCTVISVNEEKQTITAQCQTDDLIYENVRLSVTFAEDISLLLLPKIGSDVVIINTGVTTSAYLTLKCSIIDKVLVLIGNSKIEIKPNEIIFNNGTNLGLVLVEVLIQKLNALEQQLNTHQHTYVSPSGSPLITTPDLASNPIIQPSTVQELSNNKIKH